MIIEISSSGGIGGIAPGAGLTKRIDVDQQSATMRQEICDMFEPADLNQLASKSGMPLASDMMTYRIRVTDPKDGEHIYTLREDQIPPEMLDLIDAM